MSRAPFQVLVIPFRSISEQVEYALFHRADCDMWQWIAGGGEDSETPLEAARREALEEGGIAATRELIALDSIASIPVARFRDHAWAADLHVIPEYAFAVDVGVSSIELSKEHRSFDWLDYDTAVERARWDSNRVALYELQRRLARRANQTKAP